MSESEERLANQLYDLGYKHGRTVSEWQPIETAPKETTVIAYGAGGMRFMRQDAAGQWRNMMHRPRNTPTHWMPLPDPPAEETKP